MVGKGITCRFAIALSMDVIFAAVLWSGFYLVVLLERHLTWDNVLDLAMTRLELVTAFLLGLLALLALAQLAVADDLGPATSIPVVYFTFLLSLYVLQCTATSGFVSKRVQAAAEAGEAPLSLGVIATEAGNLGFDARGVSASNKQLKARGSTKSTSTSSLMGTRSEVPPPQQRHQKDMSATGGGGDAAREAAGVGAAGAGAASAAAVQTDNTAQQQLLLLQKQKQDGDNAVSTSGHTHVL